MGERAEKNHNRANDDHDTAKEDHDSLIIIKEQVGHIKETVDSLNKKIMGNGNEGICTTVLRHTEELQNIQNKQKEETIRTRWIVAETLVVFTIIVTVVFSVLNYLRI